MPPWWSRHFQFPPPPPPGSALLALLAWACTSCIAVSRSLSVSACMGGGGGRKRVKKEEEEEKVSHFFALSKWRNIPTIGGSGELCTVFSQGKMEQILSFFCIFSRIILFITYYLFAGSNMRLLSKAKMYLRLLCQDWHDFPRQNLGEPVSSQLGLRQIDWAFCRKFSVRVLLVPRTSAATKEAKKGFFKSHIFFCRGNQQLCFCLCFLNHALWRFQR